MQRARYEPRAAASRRRTVGSSWLNNRAGRADIRIGCCYNSCCSRELLRRHRRRRLRWPRRLRRQQHHAAHRRHDRRRGKRRRGEHRLRERHLHDIQPGRRRHQSKCRQLQEWLRRRWKRCFGTTWDSLSFYWLLASQSKHTNELELFLVPSLKAMICKMHCPLLHDGEDHQRNEHSQLAAGASTACSRLDEPQARGHGLGDFLHAHAYTHRLGRFGGLGGE